MTETQGNILVMCLPLIIGALWACVFGLRNIEKAIEALSRSTHRDDAT